LGNAGKELDRLKKEGQMLGQTADQRQQEIQRLQDHLQNQGAAIQKLQAELAERDAQMEEAKRRLQGVERDLQDTKAQIASAEEELRNRGQAIDKLQGQVRDANEDVANKLVALSMILEKLTQARDEFEAKDAEIEALHATLTQVERERLEKDTALKQFKADEFAIVDEMSHAGNGLDGDRDNKNKSVPQTAEEQELNRLFASARETLGVLGVKASYSYAALKTKDDLDALYDEQLTVTGAEMILRDKKINLLVEKVIIAEKFINDVLRLLGQQEIIKPSSSAGMKFRQDAAVSGNMMRGGQQQQQAPPSASRSINNNSSFVTPASAKFQPPVGGVAMPGMQRTGSMTGGGISAGNYSRTAGSAYY